MNTNKVSIVIPNWNGEDLLTENLPQVIKAVERSEIIVVDDASTDNSVLFIHQNYPSVRVIKKRFHDGFASTVNEGVKQAKGDIVILLNTDVVPEKGFLEPLIRHFHNPNIFAVGCMDKSIEDRKIVLRGRGCAKWRRGFYIHWRGNVNQTDTAWVSGGSGAFRKSMFLNLGGMDKIFNPFYWEDIDLSYRAAQAGYLLKFESKSVVYHFHEKGKIKNVFSDGLIKQMAYRGQFIFTWKHLVGLKPWLEHIFWAPLYGFKAFLQGDRHYIVGYLSALLRLPSVIRYRMSL